MNKPYVDVRGPWPSLIAGQAAIRLVGCKRDITVEDAIEFVLTNNL